MLDVLEHIEKLQKSGKVLISMGILTKKSFDDRQHYWKVRDDYGKAGFKPKFYD